MASCFDRLPNMSPADRPNIAPGSGRRSRTPWITVQTGLVFSGAGLILISGFFLGTLVLGPALEANPADPAYWSEVIERIRINDGGRVTAPTTLGLILGATCIIGGLRMSFRASRRL